MKLSPALRAAFVAALAVILCTTALSYRNAMMLFDEGRWVAHTHEVRAALSELMSSLQDAELGERGFTVTGDETYLVPYVVAEQQVPEQLRRLHGLFANVEQQERLRMLEPHVDALLVWLRDTVEVRRREGFSAAQEQVRAGDGKQQMTRCCPQP
jgi:CHASE3 domain sensor protein